MFISVQSFIPIWFSIKGAKLCAAFTWVQAVVNWNKLEYLPHLWRITTEKSRLEFYYTFIQGRKKISCISYVQWCKYFSNVECFKFSACISLETKINELNDHHIVLSFILCLWAVREYINIIIRIWAWNWRGFTVFSLMHENSDFKITLVLCDIETLSKILADWYLTALNMPNFITSL